MSPTKAEGPSDIESPSLRTHPATAGIKNDNTPDQQQLFDPNRYSPVGVDVMLRLTEGSTRGFMVASALGQLLHYDGSSRPLSRGRDAAGSLVKGTRGTVVRRVLSISDRRWREWIQDWEQRYIAHRCSPGAVFLFAHTYYDECPACHAYIHIDHMPPRPNPAHGPGLSRAADIPPQVGRNPAGAAEEIPPLLGTNVRHHKSGSTRDVYGVPVEDKSGLLAGVRALEYLNEKGRGEP